MNEQQIELINNSWDIVMQHPSPMLAFYDRLFEIAPNTKHYFPDDITKQSEKLAYTVGFVVSNLERFDEIKGSIEDLGRFHNKLKIQPEHYMAVKTALIDTIESVMGDKYSKETGDAWDVALTAIATIMINAPEKREPRFKKLLSKIFG